MPSTLFLALGLAPVSPFLPPPLSPLDTLPTLSLPIAQTSLVSANTLPSLSTSLTLPSLLTNIPSTQVIISRVLTKPETS